MKLRYILRRCLILGFAAVLLSQSAPTISSPEEKARRFTRPLEFDYVSWTLKAIELKLGQASINPRQLFTSDQQHQIVNSYIELIKELEQVQLEVERIYSDPSITDPAESAQSELLYQENLQTNIEGLAPLAESVLQEQVSTIIVEMGIAKLGDVLPPLLFHSTPLPKALIVSPRDVIQQDANISLLADLTLEQITRLENQVGEYSDSSVLVVDIGGVGVYPTMVMRSSSLTWIIDTIAHEWTHNYLTLRPLGVNYDTTPELRTMNETAASIAGNEISEAVLERYYPELLTAVPAGGDKMASSGAVPSMTDTFDFRAEMHKTRVHVDELLAEGKIEEAEQYMEEQRLVFVNHGYMIRKLNQAYFAFHGAYADEAGGAAGQDPVGPAVRELRARSGSLAEFLQRISAMTSFEELQAAIADE